MLYSRLVAPLSFALLSAFFPSCSSDSSSDNFAVAPFVSEDSAKSITRPAGVFAPYHMGKLDSAVLYCWCFKDGESRCLPFTRVLPGDICKPNHRYLAITDPTHLANFRALINKSKSRSNSWGGDRDSRFVIWCFEKDSSYMLTYDSDTVLIADASRELVTAKPILAWIMSEMGLSEIDCQD